MGYHFCVYTHAFATQIAHRTMRPEYSPNTTHETHKHRVVSLGLNFATKIDDMVCPLGSMKFDGTFDLCLQPKLLDLFGT